MFNTTNMQPVEIEKIEAEAVLLSIYNRARDYAETNGCTFAWANVFIPRVGGLVFAEVRINELDAVVEYMVGVNPVDETDYLLLDYKSAVRELRGYLASEVIF